MSHEANPALSDPPVANGPFRDFDDSSADDERKDLTPRRTSLLKDFAAKHKRRQAITKEILDACSLNYEAFKATEATLTQGIWSVFQDGKFLRDADTEHDAVKGLPLGYFCGVAGSGPETRLRKAQDDCCCVVMENGVIQMMYATRILGEQHVSARKQQLHRLAMVDYEPVLPASLRITFEAANANKLPIGRALRPWQADKAGLIELPIAVFLGQDVHPNAWVWVSDTINVQWRMIAAIVKSPSVDDWWSWYTLYSGMSLTIHVYQINHALLPLHDYKLMPNVAF